jgi:hypothetical protein
MAERPEKAETAWERRKRLAAVFGDVLPESTSDDRDDDTPPTRGDSDPGDDWLRAQVPPHHG